MTVYSVYEPPGDDTDIETRADKVAFVKDGFAWLALFFPALWMLFQRMWLELIAFLVLLAAVPMLFGSGTEGRQLAGWTSLGLSVLFAFIANDLKGWSLQRRGYRFAAAVSGSDRLAAERNFFNDWLPEQERRAKASKRQHAPAVQRANPALPPTRPMGRDEVIGSSFPRA